jgi:hypothetical protein
MTARRKRLLAAVAVALALLLPAAATADPSASEVLVARMMARQAMADERAAHWTEALEKFSRAILIKETAPLHFHVGLAHEHLGHLVEAQLAFERGHDVLRGSRADEEIRPQLEAHRRHLLNRVPTLTLRVRQEIHIERLFIDNALANPVVLGEPIPLNPGSHRIRIEAKGHHAYDVAFTMSEGLSLAQDVDLMPLPRRAIVHAEVVDGHCLARLEWEE